MLLPASSKLSEYSGQTLSACFTGMETVFFFKLFVNDKLHCYKATSPLQGYNNVYTVLKKIWCVGTIHTSM